jgi:hypothetical protein
MEQRYNGTSSRRAVPNPRALQAGGFLQRQPPSPPTLRDHMRTPEMNRMLRRLFVMTTDPFRNLEEEFCIDSTFLHTPNSEVEIRTRGTRLRQRQCKLNIGIGCETLAIFGAVVADEHVNDQNLFIPTLNQFALRFKIDTIYADAGYCDGENYEAVHATGGTAMIDFSENPGRPRRNQGLPHHDAQLAFWRNDYSGWLSKYHKRNLVETANSVFKRLHARSLLCRYEETMENEALTHVLVYNLIRTIHARYEFGIAIDYADDRALRVIDGHDA